MRIFLLSISSCFLVLSANSQIVNIPDANFKNALINHVPVINTNLDGEIQVSEAVAFTGRINVSSMNIADLTGINAFTNITELYCPVNQITSLSMTGFNSLTRINCGSTQLTSLSLNGLPELRDIDCSQSRLTALQLNNLPKLQVLTCTYNYLTSASFAGFPSLRQITMFGNSLLTDLTLDNLPSFKYLSCSGCNISNLILTSLPVFDTLSCGNNKLTSITIPNPANLKLLAASSNLLTSLPAGLTGLKYLDVQFNRISNFPLDNMNALESLNVGNNLGTSLSVTNKPALRSLNCGNNFISNLQLSNLSSLGTLDCRGNQLSSLTLNGYNLLQQIHCENNQLTSLTLTNLSFLQTLYCGGNKLATLSLSSTPSLQLLECQSNQMTNLSLTNTPNVYELNCVNNQLTALPFLTPAALPRLKNLLITENRISKLFLENFPFMFRLEASNNPIDSLRLKNLPEFNWMSLEKNRLTSLAMDSLPRLQVLYCGKSDSLKNISLKLPRLTAFFCDSTNLISIDLSQTLAHQVEITNNPLLQYINMRNTDNSQFIPIKFFHNNLLQFICVDSAEKTRVTDSVLSQLPGQGVIVSTVCNYTPAISSTIRGTVRFDLNANGCSNADSTMKNVRINNYDGIFSTSAFTNSLGQYTFHTLTNTDTVIASFQNPSWFNVSPPIHMINIANPGATVIADFCVTANGVHPDLEITLLPLIPPRPGFDVRYRLVYRNKGNQRQSSTIDLAFEDIKLNLLFAIPAVTSQTPGHLSWSFAGLSPYESRSIDLTFHVQAPPVVNIGDVLNFTATIDPDPVTGDESPWDNKFDLKQIVRGAFDPNDKNVTEGSEIDISKSGDYLHYIIRFQNTGNDTAFNVVIKDSLANNLNWNSLVPVDASHPHRTVISKGNKVEFIFDNINLPDKIANEPASHGFISFKIKPKSTVIVGETIYNTAGIYFDFNPPVITNTVSTTITETKYKQGDNIIGLSTYPNPVKDEILFTVKNSLHIKAVNLYNTMGEKLYAETVKDPATNRKVNIAGLPTGILFLEVITNGGKAVQKITRIK